MKKIFSVLLAVGILFSLVSCGGQPPVDEPIPEATPRPVLAASPAPVPSPAPVAIEPTPSEQAAVQEGPETVQPEMEDAPAICTQPVSEPVPAVEEPVPEPSPVPAAPVHVHDWRPVTQTVRHEAVTEQVKVVDQPATEGHYEGGTYPVVVCRCGAEFTSADAYYAHSYSSGEGHGGFTSSVRSNQVWVEGTPEVSHYETRVVSDAWDEEVITGLVCASCGAVG